MKNLLIINTNFPPSRTIGTQRIIRICKYLTQFPWKISVLSLKRKYYGVGVDSPHNDLPDCLSHLSVYRTETSDLSFHIRHWKNNGKAQKQSSEKKAQNEGRSGTPIWSGGFFKLLKTIYSEITTFPDKDISWLPQAVIQGIFVIRKENIDVIFSSSPPHSTHVIATILKKLTGKKLVVDFRDPWTRSVWKEKGSHPLQHWKHRCAARLERWVIESADQIICVTPELQEDFREGYPDVPKEKFQNFYNGYDPDHVQLVADSQVRKSSRCVFTHAGSLYKKRDPSPLIKALDRVIQKGEVDRARILFQFIGPISQDLQHSIQLVKALGLDDVVHFLSPVPYQESFQVMRESDVLLLLQPGTRLQVPAKLYDYMCCDRPILALGQPKSATQAIIQDRFGIFSDYESPQEIEQGISFLYSEPEHFSRKISQFREEFNFSTTVTQLHHILEQPGISVETNSVIC
jgi:glycosyltransferase involved in cell wall biosynthesis